MDIDHTLDHAKKGAEMEKRISRRISVDGKVALKRKKRKIAQKLSVERLMVAKSQNLPDWRWVLIDYRKDNQQIKAKMMNMIEAAEKNRLLQGSGFAWARCNK